MLILQIVPRVVVPSRPLAFPAAVTLTATLEPAEALGDAPLSGELPIVPPGAQLSMSADVDAGAIRLASPGTLERPKFSSELFGMRFSIQGARLEAAWRSNCSNDLGEALQLFELHLPALLASVIPAPFRLSAMSGTIGEATYTYEFKGNAYRQWEVFGAESMAAVVEERLGKLRSAPPLPRVLSAHRYLLQARRLRYASPHPLDFLAERLLNMQKAVEVLFGEKVDGIRQQLTDLGLPAPLIEMFASLKYVRNELDVGHPTTRPLAPRDHDLVNHFTLRLEMALQYLLTVVVDALAAGTLAFGPGSGSPDESRKRMLATMAQYEHVYPPGHKGGSG